MSRTKRHASMRRFFLDAVLVGFNYWFYILKHFFRGITLIIIQTNKLTVAVFWNEM